MQYRGYFIAMALASGLAFLPASAAHAAELETVVQALEDTAVPEIGPGEENVVVAPQGEVTVFTVDLYATGDISCGAHAGHDALASIETAYSIVEGTVSEGGAPSDPYRFFRGATAQPPPKGGCPVSWATAPEPYHVRASIAISPDTELGEYPVVLQTTSLGGSGGLRDAHPTTITVRVVEPRPKERPPPPPPPPPPADVPPPPPAGGLPPPQENVSVNLLPAQGQVFVRYPGSEQVVLLDKPTQVPVNSRLDTTAGRVQLVSDGDAKGTPQSATFWNGRFTVGYTRAVVAPRARKQRGRRRASRPITELTLAKTKCARKKAGPASTSRKRRRRGLFGRGKGRFRTRGSHGAATVVGTYWYTENRCGATLVRVRTGVVKVRDFTKNRTVTVRRKQKYLTGSERPKRG